MKYYFITVDYDAKTIIDTWNADAKHFKYNSKKKNPEATSFAQIVWKSSQYIGIGVAKDNKGGTYIIANFYPADNVAGQFKDNVLPPKVKHLKKRKKKKKENKIYQDLENLILKH